MKIFIDGHFYNKQDAKISVFDHGLLYGDGVFEGMRIYNGKIFRLAEHVKRLFFSARQIHLEIGFSQEEIQEYCRLAVQENNKINGYVRLIVTRGEGDLGIDPGTCKKSTVIIIVDNIKVFPQELYEQGIELGISTFKRIPAECFDVRIKSLNYLNNVLAKMEAKRNGFPEAVMFNIHGYIAECTGDNLFLVKAGALLTPPTDANALEGITRSAVMEIAEKMSLKIQETNLTRYDLHQAEECFLTGTAVEIMPVIKIEGNMVGNGKPGTITTEIRKRFLKEVA